MWNRIITIEELLDRHGMLDIPDNVAMYFEALYQISKALVEYRNINSLSQTELSQKFNIPQSTIHRLENGDYNVSLKTLCNIMAKLGMKIELKIKTDRNNEETKLEGGDK